jgi:hypothetical protein
MASSTTQTTTVVIKGDASGLTASAKQADAALADLEKTIKSDRSELAKMKSALRDLKVAGQGSSKQFQLLKKDIDAKQLGIGTAQQEFLALGGSFKKRAGESSTFASRLRELGLAAKVNDGPLGRLGSALEMIGIRAGGGAVAGVLSLAAAIAAVAAASVAAYVSILKYAVASSEARREEQLRLEGLAKTFSWYVRTKEGGEALQKTIDAVAAASPLDRESIAKYAVELQQAGVQGQKLQTILKYTSDIAATGATDQAAMYKDWGVWINRAGGNVDKLAAKLEKRFGPVAAKQMLLLSTQQKKLAESQQQLFGSLDTTPLERGYKHIADVFKVTSAEGRALQSLLKSFFQPFINNADGAGYTVRRFFQGMILASQNFEAVWLDVVITWNKLFGGDKPAKDMDKLTGAVTLGRVAVSLLVGSVIAIGVAIVAAGVAALIAWAPVTAAVLGLTIAITAVAWALDKAADSMGDFVETWAQGFDQLDLFETGKNLIEGLWRGVKAAWTASPLSDLVTGIKDVFTTGLDMHSPSKVFEGYGKNIVAGLQQGIDSAGTPEVDVGAPSQAASAVLGARSERSVHVGEIHVHLGGANSDGGAQGQAAGEAVRAEILRLFMTTVEVG